MNDPQAFRWRAKAALTSTVLAFAVAGCQLLPPVAVGPGGERPLANGARAGTAQLPGLMPGTQPVTDSERLARHGPTRAGALAAETALVVLSASGGTYVSADGSLKVTIPPGALSKDASVKFARVDTAFIAETDLTTPGIMFAADFGGAHLVDGAAITVSAKADPRLIEQAQKRIPNFKPEMMGLTLGDDGAYYLAMPVRGNPTGAVPASPSGEDWMLAEFGPNVGANAVSTFKTTESEPARRQVLQAAGVNYDHTVKTITSTDDVANWGASAIDIKSSDRPSSWPSSGYKWIWDTRNLDDGGTFLAKNTFSLPADAVNIKGKVKWAVDSAGELWVNGSQIASNGLTLKDTTIDLHLKAGNNVVEIKAFNAAVSGAGSFKDNPAGLTAKVDVEYDTPSLRVAPIKSGYSKVDDEPAMLVTEWNTFTPGAGTAKYPLVKSVKFWDARDIALIGPGPNATQYPYTVYDANNPVAGVPTTKTTIDETVRGTYNGYGEFFECLGIWHDNCSTGVVDDITAINRRKTR